MTDDRVPCDPRDEAEAVLREREVRPVDELPDDESDEHRRAKRRGAGDELKQHVAEAHPPPGERAAGGCRSDVGRRHAG